MRKSSLYRPKRSQKPSSFCRTKPNCFSPLIFASGCETTCCAKTVTRKNWVRFGKITFLTDCPLLPLHFGAMRCDFPFIIAPLPARFGCVSICDWLSDPCHATLRRSEGVPDSASEDLKPRALRRMANSKFQRSARGHAAGVNRTCGFTNTLDCHITFVKRLVISGELLLWQPVRRSLRRRMP